MVKRESVWRLLLIITIVVTSCGLGWAEDVEMPGTFKVSGIFSIPATTSATTGIIRIGNYNFIHAYGQGDTFVGNGAGNQTFTGYDNTGLGHTALSALTSGGWNTAVGALSLGSNSSGSDNTAVGTGTMLNNMTGSTNSVIGSQAMRANTGSNNVALGAYAGYSANYNIAGSKNTYIGTFAGSGVAEPGTVLNNAAAIGYKALVTQSNSLILGATGSDADAPAVSVGIGTTAPAYKLDVAGTVRATSFIGNFAGSTYLNDNAIYLRNDTNHGLRFAGTGEEFATVNVNGPALFGCDGGVLGTACGGEKIALHWDGSGNVTVTGDLTYATPKTRHWSIAGASFIPYNTAANSFSKGGFALFSSTGQFLAPVHLPDGATVTKLTVHYLNNSSSSFMSVVLYLVDMMGGAIENTLATVTATNTGTNFGTTSSSSISYATIDNSQYAYNLFVMGLDASTNFKLGGVVIEYTVDEPLP